MLSAVSCRNKVLNIARNGDTITESVFDDMTFRNEFVAQTFTNPVLRIVIIKGLLN